MKKGLKGSNSEQLLESVVEGIRSKKGKEIVSLDLRRIDSAVCDFFVICSGDSNTHVSGIVSGIEEEVRKQLKEKPWHTEGLGNAEWVLMDYVNIAVHVFQRDAREFYDLERLWADGEVVEYEEEL